MNSQSSGFGKRLLLFLTISLTVFFCFKMFAPSRAQNSEEREIEDKIPKHVPIKVKIKSGKEKAVRDMKNARWLRDFELEVRNTSDKPIYFLELWIILPEIISENGMRVGIPLRYGRMEFIHFNTLSIPQDIPIKPGETYTFTIPEKDQRGWYAHKARGYMADPKKILIQFVQLSFGDGTGFNRTDATPYPSKKQQSFADPDPGCSKQVDVKAVSNDLRIRFPDLFRQPFFQSEPAALLPVRFSDVTLDYLVPPEPPPQSGLCCPGSNAPF